MKRILLTLGYSLLALAGVVGLAACWLTTRKPRAEKWVNFLVFQTTDGQKWILTWTDDARVQAHNTVGRWVEQHGLPRRCAEKLHAKIDSITDLTDDKS